MQTQPRRGATPHRRSQHQTVPPAQPSKSPRKKRRFSLIRTLLMLIGLGTVLVALVRYVIVPVLVMLPAWIGGGV